MSNQKDLFYLRMAYSLAEKAIGWASPNPYVGAVVVKKDVIVGYGYHERPGKPHAEAVALQRAGSLSKKSTVYVTLEPCNHWGRTPPCVESLLLARPKRVVISALDPNPLVFKKSLRRIKQAGIKTSVGLLKEKNNNLNEAYLKHITKKIPLVAVKAAISLDGKTATKNYSSQWISSEKTREYMHLLRGEYDAIMVGINTILQDDPLLTVRHPNWKGKRITRIILDSHLRFPLKAKILSTITQGEILIFTSKKTPQRKAEILAKKGVKIFPFPLLTSRINIKNVLSLVGRQKIASVLVEGGGQVLTSIFEKGLADKLYLTISPKLIGGETAPSLFQGKGVNFIKQALCLKKIDFFPIDEDIVVEGHF